MDSADVEDLEAELLAAFEEEAAGETMDADSFGNSAPSPPHAVAATTEDDDDADCGLEIEDPDSVQQAVQPKPRVTDPEEELAPESTDSALDDLLNGDYELSEDLNAKRAESVESE
jgi:hypothetical protein